MTSVRVVTRDGTEHLLRGEEGISLMEIIRSNGIDDIAALCGGCASCATCHIYVDEAYLAQLPSRSEEEMDLLDGLVHVSRRSRLSCQILYSVAIEGIRLEVAPEE